MPAENRLCEYPVHIERIVIPPKRLAQDQEEDPSSTASPFTQTDLVFKTQQTPADLQWSPPQSGFSSFGKPMSFFGSTTGSALFGNSTSSGFASSSSSFSFGNGFLNSTDPITS